MDKPIWTQFGLFLSNAARGDLGRSFVFNEPALKLILQRAPATLELALCALMITVFFGIPLGIWSGLKTRGRPRAGTIMAGSILGFSVPHFWQGLVLIMVFSVSLGWLPAGGRGHTGEIFGITTSFATWDGIRHLILPALNLALFKAALYYQAHPGRDQGGHSDRLH